ncbi:MAG TPA: spore coat associated protein CotJA [Firmicutes bacterium]|uniref:Spore coat associated protein CotJA n=1 Tax=Candidatus Fermentithermobacillus carboniphilus TaxID=3085328 RepID=A0AAT9LF86_9FIRM|nr:MAG: spore coat associated protein CotJA [Candidatus Fermentithermobacillus carboniphilus]HHW19355.1 spore coat associated protein CotJA [Candidatus Fermentithermobacillaceae bacterium]
MGVESTGLAGTIELATAFVPWQMYGRTLDLREALRLGTLFPELTRTPPRYKKPGTRGEE